MDGIWITGPTGENMTLWMELQLYRCGITNPIDGIEKGKEKVAENKKAPPESHKTLQRG